MIRVIDRAKNTHDLTGRLETMVNLIVENAAEIARSQQAQITFDCAGGKVSASIKRTMATQGGEAGPE